MSASRLPKPKSIHSAEVFEAIVKEHQSNAVKLGESLMACGWTMADAAWAAANWDLQTLAMAVANERTKRNPRFVMVTAGKISMHPASLPDQTDRITTEKAR